MVQVHLRKMVNLNGTKFSESSPRSTGRYLLKSFAMGRM